MNNTGISALSSENVAALGREQARVGFGKENAADGENIFALAGKAPRNDLPPKPVVHHSGAAKGQIQMQVGAAKAK